MVLDIVKPGANVLRLAAVWEGIGIKALPAVRELYTHADDMVAFAAARTGLRVGDTQQAPLALGRLAGKAGPAQIPAILELGRHGTIYSQLRTLQDQLDSEDAQVQLAAYNALIAHGDRTRIQRVALPDGVWLDVVETTRPHTIFASTTGEPRIVLFGRTMQVADEVFFSMPGELVTINSRRGVRHLQLWRKVPRSGRTSTVQTCSRNVADLVQFLSSMAEVDADARRAALKSGEEEPAKVQGFGMTYSQVVGVLQRLCTEHHIKATFVLK